MLTKSARRSPRVPIAVQAFLAGYAPNVQAVALKARALVLALEPDALEQIDTAAKLLGYGLAATYRDTICVIMPYKGWVNLGFPRGAESDDPERLLTGSGKRARHIKLTDPAQLDSETVTALVQASAAQVRLRRRA